MISQGRARFRSIVGYVLAGVMLGSGLLGSATPAFAATIQICPLGCPYTDIQTALNVAQPGDSVLIGPGTYFPPATIVISKSLSVKGQDVRTGHISDVTIDGSANGRQTVMRIESGVNVTLGGVTITGGHPPDGVTGTSGSSPTPTPTSTPFLTVGSQGLVSAATNGSAGADGGGIYNLGNLVANTIAVRGNTSGAGGDATGGPPSVAGAGGNGAGIFNSGTLTLQRSIISDNFTGSGGSSFAGSTYAGRGGNGAGMYNLGSLTVSTTTISGNVTGAGGPSGQVYYEPGTAGDGGSGGGIYNAGTLTVQSSTISANLTGNGGGTASKGTPFCGNGGAGAGIANALTLVVANSTLANNVAGHGGVGINDNHGTFCIISPGYAQGGSGGGLSNGGSATLINSTLSGNLAGQGGTDGSLVGQAGAGGGIRTAPGVSLGLVNTLIAGNRNTAGENDLAGTYHDVLGGPGGLTTSDRYNLVGLTFQGQTYSLSQILSTAGLAYNGGPTQTIALRNGGPALNPAIGAAKETMCQGPVIVGLDQRGSIRPTTACDLGAFEDPGTTVFP